MVVGASYAWVCIAVRVGGLRRVGYGIALERTRVIWAIVVKLRGHMQEWLWRVSEANVGHEGGEIWVRICISLVFVLVVIVVVVGDLVPRDYVCTRFCGILQKDGIWLDSRKPLFYDMLSIGLPKK